MAGGLTVQHMVVYTRAHHNIRDGRYRGVRAVLSRRDGGEGRGR